MATITFRADDRTDQDLHELTEDGTDRSAAIRDAIHFAAKAHRAARIRRQAEEVAADPDDRAEMEAVMADMEPLRAW